MEIKHPGSLFGVIALRVFVGQYSFCAPQWRAKILSPLPPRQLGSPEKFTKLFDPRFLQIGDYNEKDLLGMEIFLGDPENLFPADGLDQT